MVGYRRKVLTPAQVHVGSVLITPTSHSLQPLVISGFLWQFEVQPPLSGPRYFSFLPICLCCPCLLSQYLLEVCFQHSSPINIGHRFVNFLFHHLLRLVGQLSTQVNCFALCLKPGSTGSCCLLHFLQVLQTVTTAINNSSWQYSLISLHLFHCATTSDSLRPIHQTFLLLKSLNPRLAPRCTFLPSNIQHISISIRLHPTTACEYEPQPARC